MLERSVHPGSVALVLPTRFPTHPVNGSERPGTHPKRRQQENKRFAVPSVTRSHQGVAFPASLASCVEAAGLPMKFMPAAGDTTFTNH